MMPLRTRVELSRNLCSGKIRKALLVYSSIILVANIIILSLTWNISCDQPLRYVILLDTIRRFLGLIFINIFLKLFLCLAAETEFDDIFRLWRYTNCTHPKFIILTIIDFLQRFIHLLWFCVFFMMNLTIYACKTCETSNSILYRFTVFHLAILYVIAIMSVIGVLVVALYVTYVTFTIRHGSGI